MVQGTARHGGAWCGKGIQVRLGVVWYGAMRFGMVRSGAVGFGFNFKERTSK